MGKTGGKRFEEFRGAPTRAGRWILFAFGAPFNFGGLAMLGAAAFGGGKDRLASALCGTMFLLAGMLVWAPVFPSVVNRLRRSDHPLVRALMKNAAARIVFGLLLLMGGMPILAGLGILAAGDSGSASPRWVMVVAGGLLWTAALYMALQPAFGRMKPAARKMAMGLFPLLIVTGMAAIADWIAFGSGGRSFGGGTGIGPVSFWTEAGDLEGRIVFGLSGAFLTVAGVIGWWKYLRRDW